MQPFERMWLGLAAIGTLGLGCADAIGDDEVGDSSFGDDETKTGNGNGTGNGSGNGSGNGTGNGTGNGSDDGSDEGTDGATEDTTDGAGDEGTTGDPPDPDPGSDDGDFELIDAAFADGSATLVLTFSTSVASVDAVAPSDFRISAAITMSYEYEGMTYDFSYYCDPNVLVFDYAPPIEMVAIANGPKTNQISLEMDPVFDLDACEKLDAVLEGLEGAKLPEGHFFTHYAPGSVAVTSAGGSPLAAIGPDWVGHELDSETLPTYGWPNLDPKVAIPCP